MARTVVSTVDLEVSVAPKGLKAYNWAEVRIIGVVFKMFPVEHPRAP